MRDAISVLDPRRIGSRHPEWPVVAAAAAAWVFLAARPHAPMSHHHGPVHGGTTDVAGLAAMVVAMMLPLTIAGVREAAPFSLQPLRRHWSMAKFLAGYLLVWMLAMVSIDVAWRQLFAGGTGAAVGMMLCAALWELTPAKQRRPRGCGTGSQPNAGLFRSGLTAGGACVVSCWALMALCVAFAHDLRVMAALFCVQLIARYRPSLPPALAALAVLVVCLASLALHLSGSHAA